jgi:hypothetical protein
MGGQPGKPKPPGNPPNYPDDEDDEDLRRTPIDEPLIPIPVPPVERPPAPIRFSRGRSELTFDTATGNRAAFVRKVPAAFCKRLLHVE